MEASTARDIFIDELDRVLHHLYDPGTLRRSPLIKLFDLEQRANRITALQRILLDAIESLRPDNSVPSKSNAWRVYHILNYRYAEQSTQREVSTDLGLSIRQLRRQEKVALQVLADYLWNAHDLGQEMQSLILLTESENQMVGSHDRAISREQELDWLERTVPSERIEVQDMIDAVLETAQPFIQACQVAVHCHIPQDLPPLNVQRTPVRQALLYVLTIAAHCAPKGRIEIVGQALSGGMWAHIQVNALPNESTSVHRVDAETLEIAQELIQLSGGSLDAAVDAGRIPFAVRVTLPTGRQVPVLVIDDNVDTLQLLERYLSGSRYRFVGISDPHQAFKWVEQVDPRAIVLDVMLPGIDGWELLAHLREHPQTRDIPILVSTILPQERLALTLGAADFIHKPFSRQALLSALDRQVDLWMRESR